MDSHTFVTKEDLLPQGLLKQLLVMRNRFEITVEIVEECA